MILYEVWYADVKKDSKFGGGGVNCVNVMADDLITAITLVLDDTEKNEEFNRTVHDAKELNGGRCLYQREFV